MRSYQDMNLSSEQSVEHFVAFFAFHHTREQFHAHIHSSQKLLNGGEMLFGQNLRWSHHARLITVVNGYEHGHQGHQRLARTHVTLHQPVHLSAGCHVLTYLMHHPFLCVCQLKRQVILVKVMKLRSHMVENVALVLAFSVVGIAQNVELNVKQFLKLEP